eukprot:CAMPEP_0201526446 /NCGR_PEP_ID=MMETSP0161_2-20130828/31878_1 /ASSEMBLY_ACC=CAM_ASM_000251 /TAXON_ID=180227 /ORGANISM="Neoparamoeba aestuarina, Strain SoJaBio B1-5/56/2" /LENGTH=237 /DNA_ID=CAMNT_0047926837 /DNA_START=42 /DNA_END=752 /DNA_ORIENTATION=-
MAEKKTTPIKAIIFDCDGLLLDTEPLYTKASQIVLEKHGVSGDKYDDSVRQHIIGVCEIEGAKSAIKLCGLEGVTPEQYLQEREDVLEDIFPTCTEMAGARKLVNAVLKSGMPVALATSANRNAFELKLKNHQDWVGAIPKVVTGCQLQPGRGKPMPDIFLKAASLIDFTGREGECLVFEDAPSGSKGAHTAGMHVIAVPDPSIPHSCYEDFTDEILTSLEQFDPEKYELGFLKQYM